MFKKKFFLLVSLMGLFNFSAAKNVEFANIYFNQAGPELVQFVDEVAAEIGYTGNYELVEPNKVGLQVNPNHGMICSCLNPQTQNNMMIINPDWFNSLSKDEQKFLVARYLLKLDYTSFLLKLVNILPLILILLLYLILFLLWRKGINKTSLRNKPRWQKILIVYLIAVICNWTVVPKIQKSLSSYLVHRYEVGINQVVLAKLPNKLAAVSALKALDQAIKSAIEAGHNQLKSAEDAFMDQAKDLEK